MAFKNLSGDSDAQPGQPVPDGGAASLQPPAQPVNPRSKSGGEASSTAFDALSLFSSEDAADASGAGAIAGEDQRTTRQVAAPGGDRPGAALPMDSAAADDLRGQFRQTELDLERLKSDAAACSGDIRQLRELAAQLAQEFTRLTDAGRQTETRAELAAESLAALENRLGPIERIRELTNSTGDRIGSLAQLAEQVMSRAADFQVHKELIDHALVEATRIGQLLPALDARVATLAEHEQVFRHAEETVGHLERRAADAAADLERRVDNFQSQKRTIEQALDDATRATDLLSSLDARLATLSERDQTLRHAEQTVGHLERRSAEVAIRLEQAATIASALEHDLARLKKQLRTLDPRALRRVMAHKELEPRIQFAAPNARTATAGSLLPVRLRVLTHTLQRASTALGDRRDRLRIRLRRATGDMRPAASQARPPIVHTFARTSDDAIPATPAVLPDLGAMAERAPQRPTTTRSAPILTRPQKSSARARLWVAGVGVLVTLLGIGAMRWRDYSTPATSPGRMARQNLAAPDPVAALSSRTLGGALLVLPEGVPGAMISSRPTNDAPAAERRTEDLVRPPAVVALATGGSGSVPSAGRSAGAGPLRDTSPPERFIGDLRVESLTRGAAVFIDQRDVGRTPVQVRRLRAGSHVIRIEHDGYERWTNTALVPADQQTLVRATLQPSCCPQLRPISY